VSSAERWNYCVRYNDGDVESCTENELSQIALSPELARVEVGSRIAVLWEDDTFYEATVTRERNKKRPFRLKYDSGKYEWIDLRQTEFRLIETGRIRSRNDDTDTSTIEDATTPPRGTKRRKRGPGASSPPRYDVGTKVRKVSTCWNE
jgi:hypothetical protein